MPSRALGGRWFCFALLTLSCGPSAKSGPGGAAGASTVGSGGAGMSGAGMGGTGTGGAVAGTGGKGSGGLAGGGSTGDSGGSAGTGAGGVSGDAARAGAGTGGSSGGGAGGGASGGGKAGATAAGSGGAAGTSAGAGGAGATGFPPFSAYAPVGNVITLSGVSNASDIAWKPATDTFFVVANGTTTFREYSANFATTVRTISLVNSPADSEGLAYLGQVDGLDRFAFAAEGNEDEIVIFELDPDATTVDFATARLQTYVPGAEPPVANKGWEGVAYRAAANGAPAWLWACQEGDSAQVPMRVVGFPYLPNGAETLSYADDSLTVAEPWDAVEALDTDDLSGLVYDADTDTLLVLSDLGSRLMRVNPATGELLDTLALTRSPQYEGVTLASEGRLVLVSEPNFVEIFARPLN